MFAVKPTCAVVLTLGLLTSAAHAEDRLSASCMHAVAAATSTFGHLVANQMIKLDGTAQLQLAETALSLAHQLDCPRKKTLTSVNCIVAFVHANSRIPEPADVVTCVEEGTGQVLFPKN